MTKKKVLFLLATLLPALVLSCKKAGNPVVPDTGAPETGCPQAAVPVAVNTAGVTFNRDTSSEANKFEGGSCVSGSGAPDDLFTFTLSTTTRVQIARSASWAIRIVVRKDSCTGIEVDCHSNTGLSENNLAAGIYYVIVDGDTSADQGTYGIEFKEIP